MKSWDNFLKLQEKEIGFDTVNKWLRPLKVSRFDARNIYLEAKDSFQVIWFEEHIRKKVDALLYNNNKQRIKVHLEVPKSVSNKFTKTKTKKSKSSETSPHTFLLTFDELDPHCTFENFVVSDSNLLAYKLLCKVTSYDPVSDKCITSEDYLASFNPIYIFGGTGTGKTHLLMATAQALRNQGLNILYVRAKTFTEHVVSAIRAGEMNQFRAAYRNIDVLLIDNVHVFSRKNATQEELFHTFNTLHLAGKQIILTANCSPGELQLIEPRLVSRFEWGIAVHLEQMTENDLRKVLEKKAEALKYKLHPKVQDFLLNTFTRNSKSLVRALESLILRIYLKKKGKLSPTQLTVPIVKQMISDLIEQEQQLAITPEKIVQTVAELFGIRTDDLFSKAQSREFVLPRQVAMHFCRTKLKMPFMKIGDFFDRDHSTVMSSVKLIQKSIEKHDRDTVDLVSSISKKLK